MPVESGVLPDIDYSNNGPWAKLRPKGSAIVTTNFVRKGMMLRIGQEVNVINTEHDMTQRYPAAVRGRVVGVAEEPLILLQEPRGLRRLHVVPESGIERGVYQRLMFEPAGKRKDGVKERAAQEIAAAPLGMEGLSRSSQLQVGQCITGRRRDRTVVTFRVAAIDEVTGMPRVETVGGKRNKTLEVHKGANGRLRAGRYWLLGPDIREAAQDILTSVSRMTPLDTLRVESWG